MEWPKELLDIFNDPLLADVHPKSPAPTPDDHMAEKLQEINKWVKANGREPKNDGDINEKRMARALTALRETANESLRAYDELKLLNK